MRADHELAITCLGDLGLGDAEVTFVNRPARAGRKQNLHVFHVEAPEIWAMLRQLSERSIGWWFKFDYFDMASMIVAGRDRFNLEFRKAIPRHSTILAKITLVAISAARLLAQRLAASLD
jgi:hypothetical protein